jgi:hypothetical protein
MALLLSCYVRCRARVSVCAGKCQQTNWTVNAHRKVLQFVETKDNYFFMANDKINDMVILNLGHQAESNAVLACQDRRA